jgi:AcrR family transcriptional regulator
MSKQKRDSEVTKTNILKTSMELFSVKGFDATTVDDIAVKSNINKAMIYYYYKNKAGLYEQVMSVLMENIYIDINKEYQKSSTATEGLKAFILTYGK